jgi:predicted dinucleotide-binding enzyme
VVLSNSRSPETLADMVSELRPQASAASSTDAAAAGDIVVVAVPAKASPNLPAASLAGKTVIDTCDYGPERDGPIPELGNESLTSSELLLRYLPGAVLVKAFNNRLARRCGGRPMGRTRTRRATRPRRMRSAPPLPRPRGNQYLSGSPGIGFAAGEPVRMPQILAD